VRLQSGSGGGFRRVTRKGERKMARASFPPPPTPESALPVWEVPLFQPVDDVHRSARSFLDAAMPRLFNEPRH
jgi:hypothetical protein